MSFKKIQVPSLNTLFLGFSLLGLLDTIYLSYTRYMHIDKMFCNGLSGCGIVESSPYAVMFGVPLAYLGLLFYMVMFIISLLLIYKVSIPRLRDVVLAMTIFGALDSIYFIYLQAFVIKAFCFYCIISAIITFCLATLAIFMWLKRNVEVL